MGLNFGKSETHCMGVLSLERLEHGVCFLKVGPMGDLPPQ